MLLMLRRHRRRRRLRCKILASEHAFHGLQHIAAKALHQLLHIAASSAGKDAHQDIDGRTLLLLLLVVMMMRRLGEMLLLQLGLRWMMGGQAGGCQELRVVVRQESLVRVSVAKGTQQVKIFGGCVRWR